MSHEPAQPLISALRAVFSPQEAAWMALLIRSAGTAGEVAYQDIDLPAAIKDECILSAYEDRLLLPRMSLPGSAWEDRLLAMGDDIVYFMPRVVKALMDTASVKGVFEPAAAIRHVLSDMGADAAGVERRLRLFLTLQPHAKSCRIEAGLMEVIHRGTTADLDLHDVLDQFVLAGMMSPCPSRSIATGLAWYEIHPALYWGKRAE